MKILLDTHAFLWFHLGESKLSSAARAHIIDPQHEKLISPVVYWEIAVKVSIGKMQFAVPYQTVIDDGINQNGFTIEPQHASIVATLPFHHRDPFDRMLIAQAINERAAILSRDAWFDRYPVHRIW